MITTNESLTLDAPKEDARQKRTRLSLEEAVLQLASERDVTTASVSELTRRAGVVRTTFYAHAQTPVQLLTKVLSRELDDVRSYLMEELQNGVPKGQFRELTHRTTNQIIDHVMRHHAVYGSMNSASSSYALRTVLGEHVAGCVIRVLEGGYVKAPSSKPDDLAMYATFLAAGTAGAIEHWLLTKQPKSRAALIEAINAMMPDWYA